MKEEKYRISMVGYLNTQPFKWALEDLIQEGHELILENPANCARSLLKDRVDLALIPVGSLKDLDEYHLHTDYCIGCDGEVRTVVLLSNDPIDQVHTIFLDDHSRTSQLLARVVISGFKGISCEYSEINISEMPDLKTGEAALMIGDKVFDYEDNFSYSYDLGMAWKDFTGLPFVFAVWVSKKAGIPSSRFVEQINDKMEKVFNNLDYYLQERPAFYNGVLQDRYFRKNISYGFDKSKKMALQLFLRKVEELKSKKDYLFSSR
ncbi:MAG: menaquinone biosynthesis protein [Saprospiraceae bacterium]|nr:menaquinone biosynthesis protein [Saprospiraceae bacterium]